MLNAATASVWNLWQQVKARATFQPLAPSDTAHSSSRIIYVPRTEAGVRVTEDVALTYGAVFACVRIIGETLGTLGWHVFRELPNGGKERVPGTVQFLLRDQPNPETTAFSFREQMVASALLWGGGYAEIVTDGAGRAAELWQIAPDRVRIDRVRRDGRLVYEIDNHLQPNSVLERDQVFHLHGLGFDGISGYSVVRLAARSIGIGLAGDRFAGAFYGNGTWAGGVLATDATLNDAQKKNLKESWQEMLRGPDRAFHPAILEAGLKYQQFGMPMTDAQFLESRRWQVTEIARWFRIPPHKLADLERATFTNIEMQSLEFVQDTVLPWAIRLEQEANRKMFGANRQGLFTKLNMNSLLRGDVQSRFNAYATGRQWGWLSANDVRELEDMNPLGAQGNVYLSPLNMVNAKTFTDPAAAPPPRERPAITVQEDDEDDAEEPMAVLRQAHQELIESAFARVARREAHWATSARRKYDGAELAGTIMGFLTSQGHQDYATDAVMPALRAFARLLFAGRITDRVEELLGETLELTLGERLVERQEQLLSGENPDARAEAARLIDRVLALRLTIPAAVA